MAVVTIAYGQRKFPKQDFLFNSNTNLLLLDKKDDDLRSYLITLKYASNEVFSLKLP